MPLGINAVRNLIAAAQAGTLRDMPGRRPRLICVGHNRAEVGHAFDVWWKSRNAAQAYLRSTQDAYTYESLAPVSGSIRIPALTTSPIAIEISMLPQHLSGDTEPSTYRLPLIMPGVPRLRFARLDVPAWGSLGDEFEFLWDAPAATGVEIFVNDGRRVLHQTGHNGGVRRVMATHAGRWAVRLVAQGLYGAITETRFVAVTVTGPRIRLNRRVIAGRPGTPAEFLWTITHAQSAFLDMPLRHERHEIGLSGTLQTEIGHGQEVFRLTAIGLDGRRRTLELATAPYPYPAFLGAE